MTERFEDIEQLVEERRSTLVEAEAQIETLRTVIEVITGQDPGEISIDESRRSGSHHVQIDATFQAPVEQDVLLALHSGVWDRASLRKLDRHTWKATAKASINYV